MSAVTLTELNQAGVVATVADGKLRLSAPAGRLTPDLRERITSNRDALLRELGSGQRAHLLALATDEGLPARVMLSLDDADVAACDGVPGDTLRAYLRALDRGHGMDAGQRPPEYTQAVHCDGCGPVWLWPESPARVMACPWCFRRKAGRTIPRPAVRKDHHD